MILQLQDRFIVVALDDERVPEFARDDYGWCIIDTLDGSFVDSDRGEPEDASLVRDWAWVAPKLNQVGCESYLRGLLDARETISALRPRVAQAGRASGHIYNTISKCICAIDTLIAQAETSVNKQ